MFWVSPAKCREKVEFVGEWVGEWGRDGKGANGDSATLPCYSAICLVSIFRRPFGAIQGSRRATRYGRKESHFICRGGTDYIAANT